MHWVTNPEWWSAIGTVGVTAIAIGISFWSVHIGKENKKDDSLRYVFQLLDDNGHRNARRRIINLDGEDLDYRKEKILRLLGLNDDEIKRKEAICKESQEIVKADFDQIGTLLKNKEIPKDEFIDFTFDCYCSIITTLLWCYCKPIAPQKNQQSFMLLYFIIN